jgi:hypothetical protein
MGALNTVTLNNTFDEWRQKTNDVVDAVNNITDTNGDIAVSGSITLTGGGTLAVTGEVTGSVTTSDLTNVSIDVDLDTEAVQDRAAPMLTGGTHTGISATYDDNNNKLNLALTADPTVELTGAVTGSVELTNLASSTFSLATTLSDNTVTQAKLADDAVGSAELKDVVSLQILNSSGTAVKTIYGAGS